jgi:hypothetical protein
MIIAFPIIKDKGLDSKVHGHFGSVSVHRAPHLLCYRALEVQPSTSACPVPCICSTLQTLTRSSISPIWVISTPCV